MKRTKGMSVIGALVVFGILISVSLTCYYTLTPLVGRVVEWVNAQDEATYYQTVVTAVQTSYNIVIIITIGGAVMFVVAYLHRREPVPQYQ